MKKILGKLIIIFIAIIIILATKSYAIGSFSISASKTTINSGESITLSITGNNAYGEVNITATNATVSVGSRFLENDTKTVTITSNSTEDIQIAVSPSSAGLGDIDENPITETKRLTIKVNKPVQEQPKPNPGETTNPGGSTTGNQNQGGQNTNQGGQTTTPEKSKVATLSNLGIKPNDFSGFKANTYSYTTEVPNNVEKIEVYAIKGHKGQTITGAGTNKTLKVGENKFDITVTAEDGKTTQTYTINVIRKEAEVKPNEEEPNENQEKPEEAFGLSELTIEGLKLKPQFKTDVYEYTLELKEDLEKLNITALSTHADTNIEITGNENLVEGENVITIIVKTVDEESGIYDKIATYQIVVNKITPKEVVADNSKQDEMKKIIIISVAVGAILLIVVILVIIKVKKSNKMYDEEYEEDRDLDNYQNNTTNEIEATESQPEDNEFYEEIKKIKSKGKRFK